MIGLGIGLPFQRAGLDMRSLWTGGLAGLWYDPSDLTSGYQESTGVTAGAINSPTGLRLDKKLGLVLGAELVTNGGFDTDTAWTKEAGWTISGGVATFTNADSTTNFTNIYQLPLAANNSYRITFTVTALGAAGLIAVRYGASLFYNITSTGSYSIVLSGGSSALFGFQHVAGGSAGAMAFSVDNVSVKLLDGLHSLQATSAARPTLSARVNLLTKTEQFDDAAWTKGDLLAFGSGSVANAIAAPDGALTADYIRENSATQPHRALQAYTSIAGSYSLSASFKAAELSNVFLAFGDGTTTGGSQVFNTSTMTLGDSKVIGTTTIISASVVAQADGWYRCTLSLAGVAAASLVAIFGMSLLATGVTWAGLQPTYTGNSTKGIYVWGAQLELGSAATRYQRVNTASDYDTVGFPVYEYFNGIGQGYATAPFPAGTLGVMDLTIALKVDAPPAGTSVPFFSGANAFALFANGGATAATGAASGSPTYVANGVAVPGGTGTTRGQLYTAIVTAGWVILEVRTLDLSAWTAFSIFNYAGLMTKGNIGGVVLCPAQTDAVRAQIRRELGKVVGLSL